MLSSGRGINAAASRVVPRETPLVPEPDAGIFIFLEVVINEKRLSQTGG